MMPSQRRRSSDDEYFCPGHRVTLLRDGPETFRAMLDAIARARRRVLFEMYWFGSDRVGQTFRDALVEASQRGLDVRVMFDAVGSLGLSTSFFEPLADFDQVRVFNPLAPWRSHHLSRLSRRDHRKLVIVDDLAFTGGINIGDPWAPDDPKLLPWRDDTVSVEGPALAELIDCFDSVWAFLGAPEARLREPGRARAVSLAADAPRARVAVLPHAGPRQRRVLFNAYLTRVRAATRRVWIANAYFLPSRRITSALGKAARRGVDVRILGPGKSDVEIVRHASRAMWGRLLRAGVRIYEYQPTILHSKTAVIDGEWSTVGSFNLDYQSLLNNLELNVSVLDRDFAATVERSFERDLEQSREVTWEAFQALPWVERALDRVSSWFRPWL